MPNAITKENEFVVKNNKTVFLVYAILACIPFILVLLSNCNVKTRKENIEYFHTANSWRLILFFFLFFGGIIFYMLYKYFDKSAKVLINQSGFWSKETGLIEWDHLWYLYLKESRGNYMNSYWLIIKTNNPEQEYKIDISGLNKTPTEIVDAVKLNTTNKKIVYLDTAII